MKNILFIAITALSLGLNAQTKKTTKPALPTAEIYKIDPAASTINWKGTKKLGSFHEGTVKVQSGEITAEKGMVKGGEVTVDMKTIVNTDLKDAENNKKLVGHLSSADFFNVEKYPTSFFKITSVTPAKTKDGAIVKGDLTMIGQTHPLEFPAKIKFENGQAVAEGVVKIDRTKWGLKYNSGNYLKDLAADKIINDEFELSLKLVAKK